MKDSITIGMDLGDKNHIAVVFDADGNELEVAKVTNTKTALHNYFKKYPGAMVAIEAGTHSPWISRALEEMGCRVCVGNPRKLRFIWGGHDKSDERDARMLGMVCRIDSQLLAPLHHRSKRAQADLTLVKSRDVLVRSRTLLIVVKAYGERLPGCSGDSFAKRCSAHAPAELWPALEPIFNVIARLTEQIRELDARIEQLCRERYPETERLRQVPGVGLITALSYVLTIEDPSRFSKSRQVGPFLGLTPRRDQSGETDKQLHITHAGNAYLRQLLVGATHYILGPFGPDSRLRRYGLAIAARGGRNAKKRAVVAVARKLSVLLHELWQSGQSYEPFFGMDIKKAA